MATRTLGKSQLLSLIITPVATGFISLVASLTLIVSIFRSHVKLSTVYRRLIFSVCVFDVIQSLAQVFSTLPMPASTVWGAIGNDSTCHLQGFSGVFGMCGVVLSSLSLTIYFLLVIKFDISEAKIKKYVEPYLHAIPIMYASTVSICIYAMQQYGPAGTNCWIKSNPQNDQVDSDVESSSGRNSNIMRWIGGPFPVFAVFTSNCIILTVIWWTVYRKTIESRNIKKLCIVSNSLPGPLINTQREGGRGDEVEESCCSFNATGLGSASGSYDSLSIIPRSSALVDRLSQPSPASIRRLREISLRAVAYILAFVATFIFPLIYRLSEMHGSGPPHFTILFLARFFYPLQGFFNALVYTYPHVSTYQRNHVTHTYFKAFWEVIKSGGDNDQLIVRRPGRRRSLRKQRRVLEQSGSRWRAAV